MKAELKALAKNLPPVRQILELRRLRRQLATMTAANDQLRMSIIRPERSTVQPNEAPLLQALVEETNGETGPIIEIGTLLGVTTSRMAVWNHGSRKIITVDNFGWNPWGYTCEEHRNITSQMLHYLVATGKVEMRIADKNEFYAKYNGPAPSMVFLDAIHDYPETKKDIVWAKRMGCKVIAGHDYTPEMPGVIQAVDEFGGPRRLCGTIWVL